MMAESKAETETKPVEETRLDELAVKFKTGPRMLSQEERDEFAGLIDAAKAADEKFEVKAFARKHGYDRRTYTRLQALASPPKAQAQRGTPVGRKLRDAEKSDREKFIKDRWEEQRLIGEESILGYTRKAAILGLNIVEYSREAHAFYYKHVDRITLIEDELKRTKAINKLLFKVTDPVVRKQVCERIFHDFIIKVYQMRALGIEVDPSAVEDARAMCWAAQR